METYLQKNRSKYSKVESNKFRLSQLNLGVEKDLYDYAAYYVETVCGIKRESITVIADFMEVLYSTSNSVTNPQDDLLEMIDEANRVEAEKLITQIVHTAVTKERERSVTSSAKESYFILSRLSSSYSAASI
jgi:hypothetical protein